MNQITDENIIGLTRSFIFNLREIEKSKSKIDVLKSEITSLNISIQFMEDKNDLIISLLNDGLGMEEEKK